MNYFMIEFISSLWCTWIIFIFSKDMFSHYKHVKEVLFRLKNHGLYVATKKCEFMQENVKFLGLLLGNIGKNVAPDKVEIFKI